MNPTRTASSALRGHRVAILVSDLFEQAELQSPLEALKAAGIDASIVSDQGPRVQGMHHDVKADTFDVDLELSQARAEEFDALVIPGGTFNADALRMVREAHEFARAFDQARKPIAVVCHGAWLLVSAGLVKGHTLTSWPSLQDDIRNAGGTWVNREVVQDGHWISSRKPDDLPAFNAALIGALRAAEPAAATSIGN